MTRLKSSHGKSLIDAFRDYEVKMTGLNERCIQLEAENEKLRAQLAEAKTSIQDLIGCVQPLRDKLLEVTQKLLDNTQKDLNELKQPVPDTPIIWPTHKCGLHLTHNQHKDYYEPIAEYVQNEEQNGPFKDEGAKARCIATDEIWELQWYPRTPVGFNRIAAPTFEEALAWALEIDAAEKASND